MTFSEYLQQQVLKVIVLLNFGRIPNLQVPCLLPPHLSYTALTSHPFSLLAAPTSHPFSPLAAPTWFHRRRDFILIYSPRIDTYFVNHFTGFNLREPFHGVVNHSLLALRRDFILHFEECLLLFSMDLISTSSESGQLSVETSSLIHADSSQCYSPSNKESWKSLVFKTIKEIEDFYGNYAYNIGFSVRTMLNSKNNSQNKKSDKKNLRNLAVTDKVQKPGGCVGIFFQLIDWKKRLVKKKLFSKKLLTPGRAKKFRGDEKMPNSKLHLIANENSGGFPKGGSHGVDVERKSEMRVPSLVASFSDGEECLSNHCELDRKGKDLEMRVVKHDSRPHKLQKTGVCEIKAVTRFGAEALHIKSVLLRAKKHNHQHHPKLASPLKSRPRITSGKSASRSSRLMGVAAKILEPGLQASRGKGTLTYHASACPLKGGIVKGGVGNAIMPNHSCYVSSASKTSMGQTSCKNCGNLLDVIDCKAEVRGPLDVPPPTVSAVITATSMVSSCKKGMPITPFHGQGRDIVLLRSQEKFASHVTDGEEENYAQQSWNETTTIRIPMPREGPAQWSSNSSCRPIRAQEDDASSFAYKRKAQESKLSSESSSSGSIMCSMQVKRVSSCANTTSGTKDFVALNRSIIGQTRMRSPTKVDSSKFDLSHKYGLMVLIVLYVKLR
ncbi:hypothetical protein MTR_4g008820 [Medicago truncatula]|uniref:Uncharacterized protein n=1 Tax=Medicago truncatula TaxID=3880 RepID=A0A072UFX7_MEDTR|nr:hypothetical protein MTR_4g008820 [Medicago truncatula]